MKKEELIFDDSSLIVLVHTQVNHCSLSSLVPQRVKEEVLSSKKDLEKILNEEPITFSYPFGYTTGLWSVGSKTLRASNFESAFSVNSSPANRTFTNLRNTKISSSNDLPEEEFRKMDKFYLSLTFPL